MDSLPPNDPNNNRNHGNGHSAGKDVQRGARRGAGGQLNENGEMDVFGGNRGDQAAVMALFLMGVASWILRDGCIC